MNFHYCFLFIFFTSWINLLLASEINSVNFNTILIKPLLLTAEQETLYTGSHANVDNDNTNYENENGSESLPCVCGQANQFKIIGGSETLPNEYPWMAYLIITKERSTFMCGGFLISDRHVVTAAHCTENVAADGVRVILGDHNLNISTETTSVMIPSKKIVIHPMYNIPERFDNDVSIVTLRKPAPLGRGISPVCLPPSYISDNEDSNNYTERIATVTGWGRVNVDGPVSDVLMQVNVLIVSNEVCRSFYSDIFIPITSRMICAGTKLGGKDSCQGDSGGPLVIKEYGRYFVIGIVSFGFSCALPDFPGVYTRVDRVLAFIWQNTIDGRFC